MIKFQKTAASLVVTALLMGGCASSSDKIATAYISPMQYQSYDCDQMTAESSRLSQRVTQLQAQVDKAASNDKAVVGVGSILFFPILFALGGNQQQEAEYGRLKGEYEALQQAAVLKKCAGVVASSTAAPATPVIATDAVSTQSKPQN